MRSRITDSIATGHANLSLPKWAISSHKIQDYYIPSTSKVHKFLGFITSESKKVSRPLFPTQDSKHRSIKHVNRDGLRNIRDTTSVNPVYEVDDLGPLNDSEEYDEVDEKHQSRNSKPASPGPKASDIHQNDELAAPTDPNKPDVKFRESHYFLKVSLANKSSKRAAVSLRVRPIPGEAPPNVYFPTGQFTRILYDGAYDLVVLFLMKIDPDKPFGDFYIDALIKSEGESLHNYENQAPMLIDLKDPQLVIFKFSSKPKGRVAEVELAGPQEPVVDASLIDAPGVDLQQGITTTILESSQQHWDEDAGSHPSQSKDHDRSDDSDPEDPPKNTQRPFGSTKPQLLRV